MFSATSRAGMRSWTGHKSVIKEESHDTYALNRPHSSLRTPVDLDRILIRSVVEQAIHLSGRTGSGSERIFTVERIMAYGRAPLLIYFSIGTPAER